MDSKFRSVRLHTGLPLKALLDDPHGRHALEKHIPEVLAAPQINMAMSMSLEQIAPFAPQVLTPEKLKAINEDLAKP